MGDREPTKPATERSRARARALAWLIHPVSVVALVALVVNDHLLKPMFGTWWTGKLSDAAGLVFFPALVALVAASGARLARRAPSPAQLAAFAIAVAGIGFVWVKATDAGAGTASALLTTLAGPSTVLRDPTDLLALPALVLAWWVARRAHPQLRTAARRAAATIVLPVAVLASVATSRAGDYEYYYGFDPHEFTGVVAFDDRIYADVGNARSARDLWVKYVGDYSQDAAWTEIEVWWSDGTPYENTLAHHALATERGRNGACVEPGRLTCYRALGTGIGVDKSHDGGVSWTPEWRIDHADEALLEERWLEYWHEREAPGNFATVAVAVLPVVGGYEVWAANGLNGLAFRDTSGVWHRIGDPLHGVVPLFSEYPVVTASPAP